MATLDNINNLSNNNLPLNTPVTAKQKLLPSPIALQEGVTIEVGSPLQETHTIKDLTQTKEAKLPTTITQVFGYDVLPPPALNPEMDTLGPSLLAPEYRENIPNLEKNMVNAMVLEATQTKSIQKAKTGLINLIKHAEKMMLITPQSDKKKADLINNLSKHIALVEKLIATDDSFKEDLIKSEIKGRIESFLESANCKSLAETGRFSAQIKLISNFKQTL